MLSLPGPLPRYFTLGETTGKEGEKRMVLTFNGKVRMHALGAQLQLPAVFLLKQELRCHWTSAPQWLPHLEQHAEDNTA